MNESEILDRAADVIERNGWTRQEFYEEVEPLAPADCPVCVLGGINAAARRPPGAGGFDSGPACRAAQALAEHLGLDDGNPVEVLGNDWNDHVAESAEQVVAELRAAAARQREVGR